MSANDTAAYAAETQIAIAAVRRASVLTASVFNKLVKQETLTKDDKSPVTGVCPLLIAMLCDRVQTALAVGDFSAQAVVNTILNRAFPDDPIVGEEDAADLRVESGKALKDRIIELANETLTAELQPGEKEEWGLGPKHGRTADQLLDALDRGNYNGGRTGREWPTFGSNFVLVVLRLCEAVWNVCCSHIFPSSSVWSPDVKGGPSTSCRKRDGETLP